MAEDKGRDFQGKFSFSSSQILPFQGVYNTSRGPPPKPNVAQSFSRPGYNDLDQVNKKVNDMEKLIRELKELNERMMKINSKQFA